MKILIIENEYESVKPVFLAIERLVLREPLDITQCDKSQNIPWDTLDLYDAILLDISLATKSDLDGYGILSKINQENPNLLNRIAIITGNDKIVEMLKERGLDNCSVKIFEKPLRYKDIAAFIKNE